MNFRNQDGQGKYNTVKGEGNHMGYDLPNKEETVNDVHFLPKPYFLQQCLQNK